MSKNIDGYKITASRKPYRRAGIDLREPVLIAADALDDTQLDRLKSDPVVHVEPVEIPAEDDASTDGEPLKPPKNAKELIEQIGQVEDVASLDTLADGEDRKTVLDAIKAQRAKIQGEAE